MKKKIKVLLVDDHPIVLQGLKILIKGLPGFEVCGETDEGGKTVGLIGQLDPDLIIVDIFLKDINGIDLIKTIREKHKSVPILTFSMYDDMLYAERAVRAGANGYVNKDDPPEVLIEAMKKVCNGEIALKNEIANLILSKLSSKTVMKGQDLGNLSDREIEVFRLLGEGFGMKEIAERLSLSVKTIETYRENIKKKLGIDSASELIHFATKSISQSK